MGYFQSGFERVTLEFRGSIAGTFLRLLVQWVLGQLVLPAAWGTAILYLWLIRCVRFSDGTTATFEGRPGRIWGWLALSAGLLHAPALVVGVVNNHHPLAMMFDTQALQASLESGEPGMGAVYYPLWLGTLPVLIYVKLVVYRWIAAGVRLRDGPDLQFTGGYFPLFAWNLLITVSVISIIGWAWVSTAYFRWIARRIEGDAVGFEFEGSGWGLLWRMLVVYGLPAACIVTLALNGITLAWSWLVATPWILLTSILVIGWYVSNTVMIKVTTSNAADPIVHATHPEGHRLHHQYGSYHAPRVTTSPPVRESPPPRAASPTPRAQANAPKEPNSTPGGSASGRAVPARCRVQVRLTDKGITRFAGPGFKLAQFNTREKCGERIDRRAIDVRQTMG